MTLKPYSLPELHEQMARVKAEGIGGFYTNYFRQELPGRLILSAATGRTVLLINSEHDFFRLYFFTTDIADLEQSLGEVEFPRNTVTGYLTRSADKRISAAFQVCGFNPIATYRRMVSYQLPAHQPDGTLEFATSADVTQLNNQLFQAFNKYTDHLPTEDRLCHYVENQWVIVNRDVNGVCGAVCFQLEGPRVNYNYVYSLTGNPIDFVRLQRNFYGVMHERGVHAGFLWINQTEKQLSTLYKSMGWQFDGLKDYFYIRS